MVLMDALRSVVCSALVVLALGCSGDDGEPSAGSGGGGAAGMGGASGMGGEPNGQLWIASCDGGSCSPVCAADAAAAQAKLVEIMESTSGMGSFSVTGCVFVDPAMAQGTCTLGAYPEPGTPESDRWDALCDVHVFNR
jgi:hypothetical protein